MKAQKDKNSMKKISKTAETFINYYYRGDGKYYQFVQGSRRYNNSGFTNFANNNSDCFTILESGNDAPRGGTLGDYVIVKFNDLFFAKYGHYIEAKQAEEENRKQLQILKEKQKALYKMRSLETYNEASKRNISFKSLGQIKDEWWAFDFENGNIPERYLLHREAYHELAAQNKLHNNDGWKKYVDEQLTTALQEARK